MQMREFELLAASLRGEALRETASALLAALRGENGSAVQAEWDDSGAADDAVWAPRREAEDRVGPASRRGSAAEETDGMQAAEAAGRSDAAPTPPFSAAWVGELPGAVRAAAAPGGDGGPMALSGLRNAVPAAQRTETPDAERVSEAVRRDSRRYDRSFR